MILDNTAWAELYGKFRTRLINGLNSNYCFADREDAVEFAFDKLMHRKDVKAYGDKYPRTEKDWLSHLHWQAKSFLSHLKSHEGTRDKCRAVLDAIREYLLNCIIARRW